MSNSFKLSGQRSLFGGAADGGGVMALTSKQDSKIALSAHSIASFDQLKKTEIEMPSHTNKMFSFFYTNKIRFAVHYPIWLTSDPTRKWVFTFALFDSFGNITTLIDLDESDLCQCDGDFTYIPDTVEYLIYGKSQITELCDYLLLKFSNISIEQVVEDSLALCRSGGFPYPFIEQSKLKDSWLNLCNLPLAYSKTSTTGNDILRHFHHSIYAHRSGDTPSLLEAWENDEVMRKIIKNRVLYSGVRTYNGKQVITPQTVVLGLNQAKVAAKISLFRPALARYLVEKYLGDKEYIVDCCAGFAGRLLGVGSLGKKYRAGDINTTTITEDMSVAEFYGIDCKVVQNDAWTESIESKFDDIDFGSCGFLGCTPYGKGKREVEHELSNGVKYTLFEGESVGAKESWNESDTDNMYTYDWVERTLVLNPNTDRFVFVLDKAGQFEEFIAEEILTDTVFTVVRELVVVIDRELLRPEHFIRGGGKLWNT